ncbi:hypothetical protein OAU13_00665 [bacterium]|nr:hypothetical protein [bacterium]
MANYKFKSATVEAHQCNSETFENVYTWTSGNGVASEKTESTFKFTYDNEYYIVNKSNPVWVLKCSDGRWIIISDRRFQQLFEAV